MSSTTQQQQQAPTLPIDWLISFSTMPTFCSPFIITSSLFLFSIYTANVGKGLLYLAIVIGIILIRTVFFYMMKTSIQEIDKTTSSYRYCNMYPLFSGLNTTLGSFVLSFTFFYLCFPMFVSNNINWVIVSLLLFYILFDALTKASLGCLNKKLASFMGGDLFAGSVFGVFISCLMYYCGGQNLLFTTEIPSNNVVCSKPSSQQFKCNVYKNGRIIGSQNI